MSDWGRVMMLIGAAVFFVGLLMTFAGRLPWFGQLPGDIVIDRGNVKIFAPIAPMIVLSIVLTVILNLAARLFR
jgi:hypothetical protein